jgi:hypothetical protein
VTDFKEPRTEIEWSRRAIINVVEVLQVHSESLTLVGAHAVLLRTMELDVPRMPTGDGDLGVTPGRRGAEYRGAPVRRRLRAPHYRTPWAVGPDVVRRT